METGEIRKPGGRSPRDRTVSELTRAMKSRDVPQVREDAAIDDVIDVMIRFRHSRLVYVVDGDGRLLGCVTLETIVGHFFRQNHEPRIHSRRHLLWMATEHASDLMNKRPLHTTPDEGLGVLLQRMIASRAMELPVVDAEGRLVGDVTMVDLLHFLNVEDA